MHQDQGRRTYFQGPFDDLAGIDGGMIDRATLLHFILDQSIAPVQKHYAKGFREVMAHGGTAIADQCRPRTEDRSLQQLRPAKMQGGGLRCFQGGDCGLTQARILQGADFGCENTGQTAKLVNQAFGQGFDITLAKAPNKINSSNL